MLKPGLYEQVINQEIKMELADTPEERKHTVKIDSAEASGILTGYISDVIKKALDRVADSDDVSSQINLVNKIVNGIRRRFGRIGCN